MEHERGRASGWRRPKLLATGVAALGLLVLLIPVHVALKVGVAGMWKTSYAEVRSVVGAEQVYADMNAGLFEARIDCLVRPALCGRGYTGSPLVHPETSLTIPGRYWFVSPSVKDPEGRSSPSSVKWFVVVDRPVERYRAWLWLETLRSTPVSLCGDSSGRVCEFRGPAPQHLERCPADCTPVK